MTSTSRRYILILLLSVVASLILVNWLQLRRTINTSPILETVSALEGPSAKKADIVLPELPLEAFSETLARPLFNPGRRPVTVSSSGEVGTGDGKSTETVSAAEFKLVGTMRWGRKHRALIRVSAEPLARWIEQGKTIDGWTVKAIERDFVIVEQESRSIKLSLLAKPKTATAD